MDLLSINLYNGNDKLGYCGTLVGPFSQCTEVKLISVDLINHFYLSNNTLKSARKYIYREYIMVGEKLTRDTRLNVKTMIVQGFISRKRVYQVTYSIISIFLVARPER